MEVSGQWIYLSGIWEFRARNEGLELRSVCRWYTCETAYQGHVSWLLEKNLKLPDFPSVTEKSVGTDVPREMQKLA